MGKKRQRGESQEEAEDGIEQNGEKTPKSKKELNGTTDPLNGIADRLKDSSSCIFDDFSVLVFLIRRVLDQFVNIIPSKYYFPPDEEEQNNRFLKHKKQKAPKQELKEASKKAKRVKLDPTLLKTNTELQKQKKIDEEEGSSSDEEIKSQTASNGDRKPLGLLGSLLLSTKTKSDDAEILQTKLREKLEELKKKRTSIKENKKKKKKQKLKKEEEKNKPMNKEAEPKEENEEEEVQQDEDSGNGEDLQHEAGDFSFGTFDFGTGKPIPSYLQKKKKKMSDEKLLKKLEAEKELLAKLKEQQGDEAAKQVEKEKATKAALLKLKGEKIKDDPKRLKKSIKAKQKKKEKSASAWQDRTKQLKQATMEKQTERENNIKEHKKAKKEKLLAKKKQEPIKRPGFEGKKKEFLNKDKPPKKGDKE